MRKTLIATAVALATTPFLGVSTAAAEDLGTGISANVGFVSDYRYRGISQSDRKPAVQGGFDFEHESGFYAGIWGSSISWLETGSGAEIDVYAGFTREIGDWFYDVGVLHYNYPGGRASGEPNPNTTEGYIGGGWGPFSLTYYHSFTNLFGADDSKRSHYLVAGFEYEVVENLTLEAHVGRQRIKNAGAYRDYRIGASYHYAGFDFGLHWIDTSNSSVLKEDGSKIRDAKGTAVLSLSKTF